MKDDRKQVSKLMFDNGPHSDYSANPKSNCILPYDLADRERLPVVFGWIKNGRTSVPESGNQPPNVKLTGSALLRRPG